MLTPRRTLLLLAGFVLFGVAYAAYARFLGWMDGLPQLPEKMLVHRGNEFQPPERNESPTQVKLAQAFGERSPETDYALYKTQLEFRNGNSSLVLAAGPIPANPNSTRVPLSPFSLAIFSKPKPAHLLQPGEVREISTIHSDKAILEFDRVIHNANDLRSAKLVRMELVSDFEQTFEDPRRGMVHITNNQRSADPNRFLVVRTPGPVFYRDVKAAAGTPAAQDPDFWTDAPVEIVDRQNLPRAIGSPSPATVAMKSEEGRSPAVVADIIAGHRAPPPTVTAIGFRIYLEPTPPPGQPRKPSTSGINGVRRFEFLEQVLLNLWIDDGRSLVGGPPPEAAESAQPSRNSGLALTPPPSGIAAVTGGLGPAGYTSRLMNRALLQIDTRGPFAYDGEKGVARFDVVPQSNPNLPNDVQVTKVSVRNGTSSLFSQVLELELNGGPNAGARPTNAPAIKKLHAWTYTTGRFLTVASQDEAMQAYGQDLVYEQGASRTVLIGSPLYVVRDRNVLSAGAPQRPATLITEPGSAPLRKQQLTVRGAGKVELFDAASKSTTLTASWQTSLVQSKEQIGGREQDLFVFTDGAKFEDTKADYWLAGNVLKLWLEPRAPAGTAKPDAGSGGSAKPSQIQAIGQVKSHSTDYDIEEADHLNVFFTDAKPAPVVAKEAPVVPTVGPRVAPVAPNPAAVATAPKPPEPRKPKPPLKIRAKDIQTWVSRVPVPPAPGQAPDEAKQAVKYQLDKARCEDNVVIHQDPTDPAKPRGIDILGRLLLLDGSPDGSIMTVYGWPTRPGEVHQEEMSLIGPEIILDEVHNAAAVKGRGALTMPTNSDLAGGELKQAEVVVIHWRDKMNFNGAKRSAEFEGKVSARQGESWVLCHTMHVVFDRPLYFNQAQKKAGAGKEKPRIDTVYCYPAAADSADDKRDLRVSYHQVEYDKSGKMMKVQQLRAVELKMEAQVQDANGGEKYQSVTAFGPGEFRVWQLGDKDPVAGSDADPPKPMPPPAKPPKDEQEMKLTVVTFTGRMTAVDKGKLFQQATFTDNIQVTNIPADSPTVEVPRLLPPRGMFLSCKKELVVWSHKKANAAAVQRMDATGNAYLRSDEYDGWGETISHDGKLVVLTGSDAIPARVMNRFNKGNDQSGKQIIYDRAKGAFKVIESFGGTLGTPPGK